MRISIWQQFSSNHSSSFTIIGTFENSEAAQRAAIEFRAILEKIVGWYQEPSHEAVLSQLRLRR